MALVDFADQFIQYQVHGSWLQSQFFTSSTPTFFNWTTQLPKSHGMAMFFCCFRPAAPRKNLQKLLRGTCRISALMWSGSSSSTKPVYSASARCGCFFESFPQVTAPKKMGDPLVKWQFAMENWPFLRCFSKNGGLPSGKLRGCKGKCTMSSMIYLLKMVNLHFVCQTARG